MNSRPPSSEIEIFKQKFIPFSEIPNQSELFLDFLNGSERVERFYPEKNTEPKKFAEKVLCAYETDRNTLADILKEENEKLRAGAKAFENIEKLRADDCVAVLTGQQAGLFSGPIYTVYKALSAIKAAEKLSSEAVKAVPVFWIASEDHDFQEISRTYLLDSESEIRAVENSPRNLLPERPVGFIESDESIGETIEEFCRALPQTEFTEDVRTLLEDSYPPGASFDRSFAKILARIFKNYGLIFVSPLNENLRKLSAPIFEKALDKSKPIRQSLLERNVELEREGFHRQVLVEEDFFPFFYIDEEKKRRALRFDEKTEKIKTRRSAVEFTTGEFLEIIRRSPENLSPNAIFRPIVQDYLFPTVEYFGGAAEIAYFAQNSAVYEILERPVTPIRHRASFTVVESKNRRTLEKFGLNFTDLFSGKKKISARVVEEFLNPETAKLFDKTKENTLSELDLLKKSLEEIEPTLADSLARRQKKIEWHIEALRKKFQRAEQLRNEVTRRRLENLFRMLLPEDALQERHLNVLYFIDIFGENFIEWLFEAIEPDEEQHQLIIF